MITPDMITPNMLPFLWQLVEKVASKVDDRHTKETWATID